MEKKRTAIEWLEKELETQCMITCFAWEDEVYFRKLLAKAKQMEKEQIIKANYDGFVEGVEYFKNDGEPKSSEQYYNETYDI